MKSFRYVVVVLALLMSVSLVKAEEVKKGFHFQTRQKESWMEILTIPMDILITHG
ncbi:hypothetical protein [Thermodesulfovibrio sp.]|uniref:hypothetical protein n=1 Tax=Thermodesulfovibrio sp. TaxID=2067987 RepID=UPI003C7E9E3B